MNYYASEMSASNGHAEGVCNKISNGAMPGSVSLAVPLPKGLFNLFALLFIMFSVFFSILLKFLFFPYSAL